MSSRLPLRLCLAAGLLVLPLLPASALINLNMPMAKIYASVKAVAVASVTAVNPENQVVDLKTTEQLKGAPVGETFRVQIAAPAGMIQKVAAGQPLVIFVGEDLGKPVALIHVADTWLLAEALPNAKTPAWRVVQAYDAKKSFAGTTAELVKAVTALKSPK
ncbi:MAG TPA: hypothetical protein VGO11_26285 [Chthoniobacteraceae bacterium]|jgi:hypothetical protein|nr:hypothetical protein [Chthoniobacteraceae bacterium]